MMLIPSWAVGAAIVGTRRDGSAGRRRPWPRLPSGLDLYLDPQMVGQRTLGLEQPGVYFGVALGRGFAGWIYGRPGVGLILGRVTCLACPLLVIYALTWLFQGLALGLFWATGPALCGLVGIEISACSRGGRRLSDDGPADDDHRVPSGIDPFLCRPREDGQVEGTFAATVTPILAPPMCCGRLGGDGR